MSNHHNIEDELNNLQSGLPSLDQPAPFSVPEGYFDGLAASVLATIKSLELPANQEIAELSPLLAGIPRTLPYQIPSRYFEQTVAGLPAVTSEPSSPLLQGIGKKLPYTAPQGYFDEFPQTMLLKVNHPSAKVVPLFARRWVQMAAAAVVGGALCVAGLRYFAGDSGQSIANNQSSDTAQSQIAKTTPSVSGLKTVSTTELNAFVKEVRVPITKSLNAAQPQKVEVRALLKDVSATEMEEFLSEVPTLDEDVFITDILP